MADSSPQHSPAPEPTCDFAAEAAAAELVQILDAYMAELQAGKAPSKAEFLARYPQQAAQLEACLAGLEFIHGTETAPPGRQQRLGDFRIIREVGRGGMGAVFEAEQISLRRRVALKILRFGGVSDPDAIERFKREAETVAGLHHTNIVPIFAVGTERGVSYYAMQFIEGQSLAEVLAEKKQPLPAERVAQWGLQAAEALAHAHLRGVIHRDVKPSNLLLDGDHRIWLTDFGLARRLDDVTLSMTGAILGTPRYMSPEQATATNKRVDHRTDLYSLGATLYELLTAQPAFTGDTPHEVIQHILSGEPKPIRDVAKGVPRDLETIVMKCLAKEPYDRYAAASDLAGDLRAFQEGRPIRARRANTLELAVRWIKSQQRSFQLAAAAVATTLMLTVGALMGWSSYNSWRQGSVKLATNSPPLVAEILNQRDEVLRTETLPMQNAATLPGGDYRLRVSGEKTLSETFDLTLARGAEHAYSLDLQDQMLWTPQVIDRSFELVDFGHEQALVRFNSDGIGLHKRRQPLHQWTIKLHPAALPQPEKGAGLQWPWNVIPSSYSGYGAFDYRPWIAPQAADLNGDGSGDLLIAARHQAWLLALSGTDGRVLWFAPRGADVMKADPNASPGSSRPTLSGVLGTPATCDCNGDGAPDVIVTLGELADQTQQTSQQYRIKCWVEAVSGKTGEALWSYDLPPDWFTLPPGEAVPVDLRWFVGSGWGSMGAGGSFMNMGRHRVRNPGRNERTGGHAYRPAAVELITQAGKQRLAIVAGTRFVTLDPANGQANEPLELGSRPTQRCQWGDLDGDGASDAVLVAGPAPTSPPTLATTVVAWSPQKKATLWTQTYPTSPPQQPGWSINAPTWPLVADLDGDGKCEVAVPADGSSSTGRLSSGEIPWGVISVLAGDSGQLIWSRRLVTMDEQINHFAAGPDIDGDGGRELYVATLEGTNQRLHIDALSSKTGATLWHHSQTTPDSNNSSLDYHLAPLQWWQSGADGWPQLVVQVVEQDSRRASAVWTFSAASGRVGHAGENISALRAADVDADGVEDLLVYNSKTGAACDIGGQLHCLRGVAREYWQRLGATGDPAADFDGDGIRDLLVETTAVSGRTARPLWTAQPAESGRRLNLRGAGGDLNGDGIEDLLAWDHISSYYQERPPFSAISGKTGRPLWIVTEATARMLNSVLAAQSHDLDGDGKREVFFLAMLDHGYPVRDSYSTHETQLWLFVASGQTGQLRWSQPLSPAYGSSTGSNQVLINNLTLSPCLADANGDGVEDILFPELLPDGRSFATRAVSGADGATLWSRPCGVDLNVQPNLADWIPPTPVDLEGDGQTEFVLLDVQNVDDAGQAIQPVYRTIALEGKDGKPRWSAPSDMRTGYWHPPAGQRKSDLLRPCALRAAGKQQVAVCFPPKYAAAKVVVLAADGKQVSAGNSHPGLWPCDVDGDGTDEVAFLSGELLCVARAEAMQTPLWTRQIGFAGQQRILQLLAQDPSAPPVIVVASDATDNSVQGINSADGKTVWSCPGLIPRDPRDGVYLVPTHVALLDEGKSAPPHVYYAYGHVSRCRQAASAATTPEPPLHVAASDDRWKRDLPWINRYSTAERTAQFIGWSLVFSLFLIVLPSGYLGYLVWSRRFTLSTLLCLPVIAGLFLTVALMRPPIENSDFVDLGARLMIGLGVAPAVIALAVLGWWSLRGRWRAVLGWLAVSIVGSVVLALFLLATNTSRAPLLPEESYDWTHWYVIWPAGAFAASYLLIAFVPLQYVALALWRRWKRRQS